MRVALLAAVVFISACASDGLNLAPPPGVDFSGHWQLNVADSDDPMHLLQLANAQAASAADNTGNSGRGGGRGGRGGGPASGYPGLTPPATPSVSALADASRFPGKLLDIKQVGGVLTFASLGQTRVCQPSGAKNSHHHSNASDRDAPLPAAREAPPPKCGWLEKTLIVRSSEQDEDRPPFEEHYSISDDGRLVEEVIFRGGRSSGFTMSRVWDKSPQ
ncbi:MAG TPA: hypothetical protein VN891_02995 [Steroidobacteraceae bacterium]|jgi:hypothetical protein|nr:hypothetical protein [Steroidobacteraceae bacterium]